MKKNKLFYILSTVLILGSVAFFGSVSANNDRNGEDRGDGWQAKEAHNNGSTLEVHILNNGKVLVRGAKVTAVKSDSIEAFTSWGSINLNWVVNVMLDSQMIKKSGGKSSISEIVVGDYISFQGTLVTTSSSPIIVNASVVKNWSVKNNTPVRTTIEGQLKSMTTTSLPSSIVVKKGDKEYTVNITTDTSVLNSLWLKTSLSSFNIGDKIRAYGVITDLTMNATVVRDTNLKQ